MKKLFIITGPSASGKSNIALSLCNKYSLDIINADSLQIYSGLDIGTAKPSLKDQKLVKHHLINIVNPWEPYTNANYQVHANNVIKNLKLVARDGILVGGSGFYINSLLYGVYEIPPTKNFDFKDKTNLELHNELKKIDPETAKIFHHNDVYRTSRALSVYYSTGNTMTYYRNLHKIEQLFDFLMIVLNPDKDTLKENIKIRTRKMISLGFIDEVKNLISNPKIINSKPMKSIGYKQMVDYLNNKISFQVAVDEIDSQTFNLAKRQLTWVKKRNNIKVIDPNTSYNKIEEAFKSFYFKD